jgi:hypothetical protein
MFMLAGDSVGTVYAVCVASGVSGDVQHNHPSHNTSPDMPEATQTAYTVPTESPTNINIATYPISVLKLSCSTVQLYARVLPNTSYGTVTIYSQSGSRRYVLYSAG